jgi:serine/threonine-protein kinase
VARPGEGAPDTLALGRHELLERLGQGGMGVVWKARDLALGRLVALKMVRADASGVEVERFHREARAVARLRHPHIVPIYAIGSLDGNPCFTMPLIEGGTLARHLERYGKNLRTAAALVEKVARAVQAAHEAGVIHRDLKPANILLDRDEPLVADFGLARLLDSCDEATRTGDVLGTPAYMAPEQADGKTVGKAADVWALGVILYELLTGRRPFEGRGVAVAVAVRTKQVPSPRSLRPDLPRDLETIVLRCLNKAPGQRYASAGDLADDLMRWLRGEPIRAKPRSWFEELGHALAGAVRHHFVGLLILLGLVAAGLLALRSGSPAPSADRPHRAELVRPVVSEEERILWQRRDDLQAGRTVALIGPDSVPPWYRYRTDAADRGKLIARPGQALHVRSVSIHLLELTPAVLVPCFSLRARVRMLRAGVGNVGLYFGIDDRATPDGPEQRFAVFHFADCGDNAGKVQFRYLRLVEPTPPGKAQLSQQTRPLKAPPLGRAQSWHQLEVRAEGGQTTLWLDGQRLDTLDRDREERRVKLWWEGSMHQPPPPPAFAPGGPLGLYVEDAWAEFSDVVIEPLRCP